MEGVTWRGQAAESAGIRENKHRHGGYKGQRSKGQGTGPTAPTTHTHTLLSPLQQCGVEGMNLRQLSIN